MNKFKLITCVSLLVLSACSTTTSQDFSDMKIEQAQQQIPDTWLLDFSRNTTTSSRWTEIYNDPILETYLRQAQAHNFDVRIAQSRVRQAQASLKRARARLQPSVSLGASASGSSILNNVDDVSDSYSLGLSGRWDPDIFGRARLGVDQSRSSLLAQKALAADTEQAVLATTARAYIRAVEAEMQVVLAKTNLDFLTESRRISEARYRLGDTAKGDFSFAEANYQNALAAYESRLQTARETKRALSILLGDFPINDLKLSQDLLTPRVYPVRLPPAQVLEQRADIAAARAQVAARFANLRSVEKSNWPSVSITGGLSGGDTFSDLFDPSDYIARLAASLAQNVFDGGAIDADITSAKADLDQSILNYEARLRSAVGEITNAFDGVDTLRRTLANLQAASISANEALRLASVQYDLGESSLLEVLQVQTRVNAIDASLIRTKASLITTLITANESIAGFAPNRF